MDPQAPQHVLDEVDREVTRRYPPGVRLLLDVVRAGKCGQHEPDEGLARVAQAQGEWNEDRASSDAFLDLAYALKNLSGDPASNELCAGALAEAWRREYPFRRGRDGDPLDALLPQLDDARAARALDRARALPRPMPGLSVRAREVEDLLRKHEAPKVYSPSLAMALVGAARAELEALGAQPEVPVESRRQVALNLLDAAREWVERRPLLPVNWKTFRGRATCSEANAALKAVSGRTTEATAARERLRRVCDATKRADNALEYVRWFNGTLKELRVSEHDEREAVKRLEGWLERFPKDREHPDAVARQMAGNIELFRNAAAEMRARFREEDLAGGEG